MWVQHHCLIRMPSLDMHAFALHPQQELEVHECCCAEGGVALRVCQGHHGLNLALSQQLAVRQNTTTKS